MARNYNEYSDDFKRMQHYFDSHQITNSNVKTFKGFKQALKKVKWDMTEGGNKFFWKYEQIRLQETGSIETKLSQDEIRVSPSGRMMFRLPRIKANGQTQHYWVTDIKGKAANFKFALPRGTRGKMQKAGRYLRVRKKASE